MSSTKEPIPIDREQIVMIALSWLAVGFFLGLLVVDPGSPRWGVRVAWVLLLAIYTTWKTWRSLRPDSVRYPVKPEDVAHFKARQSERKQTIGHD